MKPPCTGNALELGVVMAGSVVYNRLASDSAGFIHAEWAQGAARRQI